jgi:transposase-like protein
VPGRLKAIIRGKMDSESVIHSGSWRGYNGLVDLGYKKHYRVHYGKNEFTNGKKHINGMESFWSYAKRRLVKFNVFLKQPFIIISKSVNFDLIIGTKIFINLF